MASDAINLSTPLDEILRARRLSTVYQPIVSAGDGALFAHEALLRGPEASRLATPMELFAASHEAGRSGELDLLALQMAVERFAAGQFRGKLFVNVLPQTLSGVDFRVIREQAGRLHSIGCEIAIDDLGAGLSGLKSSPPGCPTKSRPFTAAERQSPARCSSTWSPRPLLHRAARRGPDCHSYSDAHRTAGGFMGHDRDGNARMFPLMTLSVGAATVDADGQQNPTELMHALSVAKQRAKSRHGNVVILRDAGEDQTVRLCSGATG